MKNCGLLVHEEISTKQFMEELRDLVKQSTDEKIKTKVGMLESNRVKHHRRPQIVKQEDMTIITCRCWSCYRPGAWPFVTPPSTGLCQTR